MRELHFTVPGPPKGKPEKRAAAFMPKGGRRPRARVYTSAEGTDLLDTIAAAARAALGDSPPLTRPVRLVIVAQILPPASVPKWKRAAMLADRIRPTVKPDYDNISKAVGDGCTRAGIWTDDCYVVYSSQQKVYREEPLTRVCVSEVAAHGTSATRAEVEEGA